MRPAGEIRLALRNAACRLYPQQGACTYEDLAVAAQVGFDVAHVTVRNMARAGDLLRVGHAKRAGGGWIGLYEPVQAPEPEPPCADARFAPLAFVLGQWPKGGAGGV